MATGGLSRDAAQMLKLRILGKLQMNFNREGAESVVTKCLPYLWQAWHENLKHCVLNLGYSVLIQESFSFLRQKERTR